MCCAAADAGEQQWSTLPTAPYVLNNKQDALAFAGSGIGWYGNGTGRVYRTTDLGEHWKAVWKSRGTYVRALEFIDEETGFLGNVGPGYFPDVTDRRPLYITRDGGEHCSPIDNFTDLTSYESPCTEIWIEQSDLPTFASRIAREMLDAVPDLTNKGMCVGIYDEEGEAISYVPLDALR